MRHMGTAAMAVHLMEEEALRAAGMWGFHAVGVRNDLSICGSPERSEFRCVVECTDQRLLVLEIIRTQDIMHKQGIIDCLDVLSSRKLPGVHPYFRSSEGRGIVCREGRHWQASPYIPGVALNRPAYALEGWRGEALAMFLLGLREASRNLPDGLSTRPFSILGYIDGLMKQIRVREPGLIDTLEPITSFLQRRLAHVHDRVPGAFCHGDFHPLNVIWSHDGIRGVIDWEFSGTKPENYDAALLIGCMGMELPDALSGPLIEKFIQAMKAERFFSGEGWQVLVEMIIAIRFAWLSEWLRNRDTEMIELETVYMHMLVDHADELVHLFNSY